MKNPIKQIKSWMHWRGISWSDTLYAVFCLGFLITTTTVFGFVACQAEGLL
jgi:hypothetical protein|tara:strand:+ start:3387 stop:3539 length:153 start_codon:yes stop_codon:yes gene_type:complete